MLPGFLTTFNAGMAQNKEGVTPLNMNCSQSERTYINDWIYVDNSANFTGASFAPIEHTDTINITGEIPANGWTNKIGATPKTGVAAYLKGIYYIIYTDYYLVNRRNEFAGVKVKYRQLPITRIEEATPPDNKKPTIFIAAIDNVSNKYSSIIADKIKTEQVKNGCYITQNAPQCSFQLYIKASVRQFNYDEGFYYCYADVVVELFNTHTKESEYVEEFSKKGVSTSRDRAAREALTDASSAINEKIKPLIFK